MRFIIIIIFILIYNCLDQNEPEKNTCDSNLKRYSVGFSNEITNSNNLTTENKRKIEEQNKLVIFLYIKCKIDQKRK